MTDSRPQIAFDLDGVLARPPLGFNVAISRHLHTRPLPSDFVKHDSDAARSQSILKLGFESLKYRGRQALPDAVEGLKAVSQYRRPVIVTARSWIGKQIIDAWLTRHGMREYIDDIVPNNTNLSPSMHKLRVARERGFREHVDDDGAVAFYLAHHDDLDVIYLRTWWLNQGIVFPEKVLRIRTISDIADDLAKRERVPSTRSD